MADAPVLQIILGSTRPGRVSPAIGEWFAAIAREHGGFTVEVVDLKEVNLPFFDEPGHPMLGKYEHEHTKRWSEIVKRADAFVFVMPEYNHGYSAVIKNAIDFLHHEWSNKPIGFVSYGGVSAGTRGVQLLKPTLTALKMVPIPESINIPGFQAHFDDNGSFTGAEGLPAACNAMLDSLQSWTETLASRRS